MNELALAADNPSIFETPGRGGFVKDSKKYAATGGWGYAQFTHGKTDAVDVGKCYECHQPVKDRDFIFTRYAP